MNEISGRIDHAHECWGMIEADHVDMVRFRDRQDDGYRKVLYALEQLLGQSSLGDLQHGTSTYVIVISL